MINYFCNEKDSRVHIVNLMPEKLRLPITSFCDTKIRDSGSRGIWSWFEQPLKDTGQKDFCDDCIQKLRQLIIRGIEVPSYWGAKKAMTDFKAEGYSYFGENHSDNCSGQGHVQMYCYSQDLSWIFKGDQKIIELTRESSSEASYLDDLPVELHEQGYLFGEDPAVEGLVKLIEEGI